MLEKILRRHSKIKAAHLILVFKKNDGYYYLDIGDRSKFNHQRRRTDAAVCEAARDRLTEILSYRSVFDAISKCDFLIDDTFYEVIEFSILSMWEEEFQKALIKCRSESALSSKDTRYTFVSLQDHPLLEHIVRKMRI